MDPQVVGAIQATWFYLLFLGVIGWFALVMVFHRALKRDDPQTFEALGSPHLVSNNAPRHSLLFLAFLFRRKHRYLHGRATRRLGTVVFWYFLVLASGFLGLFLWTW